jgi:hypothetical protein
MKEFDESDHWGEKTGEICLICGRCTFTIKSKLERKEIINMGWAEEEELKEWKN